MSEFIEAEEVREIAGTIIDAFYPELASATIYYVFDVKERTSQHKEVWGYARKISGVQAYIANRDRPAEWRNEAFFVVEIVKPVWDRLSEAQREALIDHELGHCGIEDGKLQVNAHDIEEFKAVYERRGAWQPEVRAFAQAVLDGGQLHLIDGETGEVLETRATEGDTHRERVMTGDRG